jgi:GTP 3',8-cyclase
VISEHKNECLVDPYHRRIDYLRVSLTEACNFRCVYCVPEDGLPPASPVQNYLTKDELVRFLSIASFLGAKHVRLTGGEPLLRADLVEIVASLKTQSRQAALIARKLLTLAGR